MWKYVRYSALMWTGAAAIAGMIAGGGWLWSGFACAVCLALGGDTLLGDDLSEPRYRHRWLLDMILYMSLPLLLLTSAAYAWSLSGHDWLGIGRVVHALTGYDALAARDHNTWIDWLGGALGLGLALRRGGHERGPRTHAPHMEQDRADHRALAARRHRRRLVRHRARPWPPPPRGHRARPGHGASRRAVVVFCRALDDPELPQRVAHRARAARQARPLHVVFAKQDAPRQRHDAVLRPRVLVGGGLAGRAGVRRRGGLRQVVAGVRQLHRALRARARAGRARRASPLLELQQARERLPAL